MNVTQGDLDAWLEDVNARIDEFARCSDAKAQTARRVTHAREALEETIAEAWSEGRVQGKCKEERDACLRRLTAGERLELREAEAAHLDAEAALERVRGGVAKGEQTRHALQLGVALKLADHPQGPALLGLVGRPET